jgi:hypothetical protein
MSQQPEMPSPSLTLSPASTPASLPGPESGPGGGSTPGSRPQPEALEISTEHLEPHSPQRIPRWLIRVELFLRVMLRMYIGLAVCYAPWSHTFWDQNPILLQFPTLSTIAANGAVRGIVSGLGLLNLWIALHDAIRSRD